MVQLLRFAGYSYPALWIVTLGMLAFAPDIAAQSLIQATPANVRTSTSASTPARADDRLRITVDTPDGPLSLVLQAHTQLAASAVSALPELGTPAFRVYRGIVEGEPDSWVRMSQIHGAWLGAVRTRRGLWFFDPSRFHPALAASAGADRNGTLVFNLSDIAGLNAFDSGSLLSPPGALSGDVPLPPAARASALAITGSAFHLGVSLVLDTEFQAQYGAQSADVAVGILNIADGFYTAQVDTDLYLHKLRLLASNGTMTSTDPTALLQAFTAYVQSSGLPFSGVAHLLSGKDFDGNTAGLAWVGALCNNPYGSGIDQATFSAAASGAFLAHEMGHNYGADHDGDGNACPSSGYIMASIINLGNPADEFSTCSLDYFANYRANHAPACLLVAPDAIFANDFE